MSKDVISFRDFLKNQSVSLPKTVVIDDEYFTHEELEEVESEEKERIFEEIEDSENILDREQYDDDDDDEPPFDNNSEKEEATTSESNQYYKLYQDINENFICDIHIDGVDIEKVTPRLVIESEGLSIMYKGIVENGKCKIPVNKLSFFNEGQIGKIRLEVVADSSIFTPWEDSYKIYKKVKTTIR